jgi:hypothetical protein
MSDEFTNIAIFTFLQKKLKLRWFGGKQTDDYLPSCRWDVTEQTTCKNQANYNQIGHVSLLSKPRE